MHDTADVLDFMNEQHSLQHLDVKPENLLLLAGRVKVADFGLVKDIHDATASLMGGLTPLYAPPEVFDGRPSRRSDQYSLAIVFQEMLTGELPFPGTTAMQLARQHLHARPRVTSLAGARSGNFAAGPRQGARRSVFKLSRTDRCLGPRRGERRPRAAEREEASRNRDPGVRSFVGDRCAERGPKTEVLGDGRSAPRPFGSCDGLVPRVHAPPTSHLAAADRTGRLADSRATPRCSSASEGRQAEFCCSSAADSPTVSVGWTTFPRSRC